MAKYIDINPELLRWAVERSGLALDDYPTNVAEWIRHEKKPTHVQLEDFARRAMVPLGYLFLSKPPDEELPVPDFRTRTDEGVRRPTPNLIETIFEMQRRRDWMREYLLEEGYPELPFVGSAKVGESEKALAQKIRKTLRLAEDWAEHYSTWEDALRFLRERIEGEGILIFVNGVVGNSTRRKLNPEEFQGFVLVDPVVPLIFVNGADFKVAQMFTVVHELVHIWIGQSALFDLVATDPSDFRVEKYCNSVAAEFLVPAEKLDAAWESIRGSDSVFGDLARQFKVSPIVIARRAKDIGKISFAQFIKFYGQYTQREKQKQEDKESGGDFWLTQNLRLGRRFGQAVVAAAENGRLSYTDAYDLTRLRGETFDKFAHRLNREAS